jgi:hypothetical protein
MSLPRSVPGATVHKWCFLTPGALSEAAIVRDLVVSCSVICACSTLATPCAFSAVARENDVQQPHRTGEGEIARDLSQQHVYYRVLDSRVDMFSVTMAKVHSFC